MSDNQYFTTTHSPELLKDLLKNYRDRVAVFMMHYENRETKITKLSIADVQDVLQNGVDIFTNHEAYS